MNTLSIALREMARRRRSIGTNLGIVLCVLSILVTVSTLREATMQRVRRVMAQMGNNHLTAEENVRVALALRGLPRHETRTEAARLLGQVGLSKCANHVADEISVCERQRVALARAIAGRPKAVLADEPTGNLDPAIVAEVCRYLREFCDEGATVIIVTHDPMVARTADRTLRIEAGRIVGEGVP